MFTECLDINIGLYFIILPYLFYYLQELMCENVFFIFAALQALFVVFIYKKVPETKNKTLEEITSMFRQISYQ